MHDESAIHRCLHAKIVDGYCADCGNTAGMCVSVLRAEVARLQVALEEAKRFPNGWPQPSFLSVDEDGSVNLEWIFHDNGRLCFYWHPTEGAQTIRTSHEQTYDELDTAGTTLSDHLNARSGPALSGEKAIEERTVRAIVAWLRDDATSLSEEEILADAIERGDWRKP